LGANPAHGKRYRHFSCLPTDKEWGEEEMFRVLTQHNFAAPAEIVDALFRPADEFAGSAPQHDDMTVVVTKFAS
jgi:serine phosphatase RsbU (regulator of sigma subunit)